MKTLNQFFEFVIREDKDSIIKDEIFHLMEKFPEGIGEDILQAFNNGELPLFINPKFAGADETTSLYDLANLMVKLGIRRESSEFPLLVLGWSYVEASNVNPNEFNSLDAILDYAKTHATNAEDAILYTNPKRFYRDLDQDNIAVVPEFSGKDLLVLDLETGHTLYTIQREITPGNSIPKIIFLDPNYKQLSDEQAQGIVSDAIEDALRYFRWDISSLPESFNRRGDFKSPSIEPGFFYHATNELNLQSIIDSGQLETHSPDYGTEDQYEWPDGKIEDRSYFGTSPSHVDPFYPTEGKPELLRVPQGAATFKKERYTGDIFTTENIPASALEVWSTLEGVWLPLLEIGISTVNENERLPTKRVDYAGGKHGAKTTGMKFYHASPLRFRHGDILSGGHSGGYGSEHKNVCMTTNPTPHGTIAANIPGWYGYNPLPELEPSGKDWYVYEVEPIGKVFYYRYNNEYQSERAKVISNIGKASAFLPSHPPENNPYRFDSSAIARPPEVERDRIEKAKLRQQKRIKRLDRDTSTLDVDEPLEDPEKVKFENVLDQMGMHKVGSAKRKEPYGLTYVDKSDDGKQASIIRKVNKNLNKKPYSLHNPPSMGISITRPNLKDRKNK